MKPTKPLDACSAGLRGNDRLITHRTPAGRIDMELESSLSEDGWFYVYDAGNDGDLSGPEDIVTVGGEKYACTASIQNARSVKGEKKYETAFADMKQNIIQYYASKYLRARNEKSVPPVNDTFFGSWENFVTDQNNNVVGFEVKEGDSACVEKNPSAAINTLISIDNESYPEGLALIAAAVETANTLDAAAVISSTDRITIDWENMMCRAYHRCYLMKPQNGPWYEIEASVENAAYSCALSQDVLLDLENRARSL